MKTKAVRMYGTRDLRLEEFELPQIKDDEILVKIMSDSICMSTYKLAEQGKKHKRAPQNIDTNPIIIGHEFAGVIVEVGEKWKDQFKPGMKFAQQPALNYKGSLASPGYSYEYFGGACTYCIIPFARGRVRSRKIADVLREVETLASKGYKEVVLTGIHLSSYGVDFSKEERESLLSLIQAVSKVEGIQRIRLGSLEPRIITEEFLEGIVATGKVCPHFHLSLQSGCNKTLKNMNRRYSAQEYAEKCELIRKYYPAPALTTDVIVGFPMETEEDFEESYEFVKNIHFYETHIFKYSRRHGTKAAAMDGQLTEAVKAQRSEKLLELHDIRAKEYEEAMIGKTIELLLEEEIEEDGKMWYVGHSREYVRAVIEKTEAHQVNDLVEAKVTGFVTDHLLRAE